MSPRVPTRTPGLLAWLRLVRVYHKLQRAEAGRLRCWGLSPAQFDVLAHVGAAEGLSQQRLADVWGIRVAVAIEAGVCLAAAAGGAAFLWSRGREVERPSDRAVVRPEP